MGDYLSLQRWEGVSFGTPPQKTRVPGLTVADFRKPHSALGIFNPNRLLPGNRRRDKMGRHVQVRCRPRSDEGLVFWRLAGNNYPGFHSYHLIRCCPAAVQ
jgi:hypothetical protein